MGETVMQLGTNWGRVVVDDLIGGATLVGGVVGVAAVAGLGYGAYKLAECISRCNSTPPAENAAASSALGGVPAVASLKDLHPVVPANVNRV